MVLPLRVWPDEQIDDVTPQLAHTIDISVAGGRLGGLRTQLRPGQTVLLQRGQQRAPFRVVWNKELAPNENQAGVEALDVNQNVWGIDLPRAHGSHTGWRTFATSAPAPIAFRQPVPTPRLGRKLSLPVPQGPVVWGLAAVLLIAAMGLALYEGFFVSMDQAAILAPAPAPPTPADLARMTPKPVEPPLVEEVTTWSATPVARLQVAAAPTERMVYPVTPEGNVSGKVRLKILIAVTGRIKQIQVLSGQTALVRAAERAIQVWSYKPLREKGQPAEGEANVIVNFRGSDAVSVEFPGKNNKTR